METKKERPRTYRAFSTEFLEYMRERGGPPRHAEIMRWFRTHYDGVKSEYLTDIKQGRYAPAKCVTGFIEMLIREPNNPDMAPSRMALRDFLAERSLQGELAGMDLDSVLSHTCTPTAVSPPDKRSLVSRAVGAFGEVTPLILQTPIKYWLLHSVRGCDHESSMAECIEWMYVRLGQMTHPEGISLSNLLAIEAATATLGMQPDVYTERARLWHDRAPWSVVRATNKGALVGMSIVLPLQRVAYESILNGETASFDVAPEDFAAPTNYFVFEALAENPAVLADPHASPRQSLTIAVSLQLAALMRPNEAHESPVYHLLSFAGTPTSKSQLAKRGFRATGRQMAKTDCELFERVVNLETGDGVNFLEAYFLQLAGRACPETPPVSES